MSAGDVAVSPRLEHRLGRLIVVRTSLLWQEGPFCCELRPDTRPPTLAVRKHGDELVELEIHSELEARERAMSLRDFVRAHLARASR